MAQRSIKYRCWDKKFNRMALVYALEWKWHSTELISVMLYHPDGLGMRLPEEVDLEEFTGLHDKHGEEIYEGDVVRSNEGTISFMKYCDETAGFKLVVPHPERDVGWPWDDAKVIGNIHENPELLEK